MFRAQTSAEYRARLARLREISAKLAGPPPDDPPAAAVAWLNENAAALRALGRWTVRNGASVRCAISRRRPAACPLSACAPLSEQLHGVAGACITAAADGTDGGGTVRETMIRALFRERAGRMPGSAPGSKLAS